jgi:hypothetical protein
MRRVSPSLTNSGTTTTDPSPSWHVLAGALGVIAGEAGKLGLGDEEVDGDRELDAERVAW